MDLKNIDIYLFFILKLIKYTFISLKTTYMLMIKLYN